MNWGRAPTMETTFIEDLRILEHLQIAVMPLFILLAMRYVKSSTTAHLLNVSHFFLSFKDTKPIRP